MAKKKEPEPPENHERWLVSFADFMTLLFALFVVLFSNSQSDSSKEELMQISSSFDQAIKSFGFTQSGGDNISLLNSAGGGDGVITVEVISGSGVETPQKTDEPTDDFIDPAVPEETSNEFEDIFSSVGEWPDEQGQGEKGSAEVKREFGGVGAYDSEEMDEVYQDLKDLLKNEEDEGKVDVKKEKRGIVISLGASGFFASGSDKLRSLQSLDELAEQLKKLVKEKNVVIRAEGHTDNRPLSRFNPNFDDNQELSTARANSVVRRLRQVHGFPPANTVAVGYGEHRPVAPNNSAQGRAKNRRVDIVLLSDESAALEGQ